MGLFLRVVCFNFKKENTKHHKGLHTDISSLGVSL